MYITTQDGSIYKINANKILPNQVSQNVLSFYVDNKAAYHTQELKNTLAQVIKKPIRVKYCSDARLTNYNQLLTARTAGASIDEEENLQMDRSLEGKVLIMLDHHEGEGGCGARGNSAAYDKLDHFAKEDYNENFRELAKYVDQNSVINARQGLQGLNGVYGRIQNSTGDIELLGSSDNRIDWFGIFAAAQFSAHKDRIYKNLNESSSHDNRGTDFLHEQNPLLSVINLTTLTTAQYVGKNSDMSSPGSVFEVKPWYTSASIEDTRLDRVAIASSYYALVSKDDGHGFSSTDDQVVIFDSVPDEYTHLEMFIGDMITKEPGLIEHFTEKGIRLTGLSMKDNTVEFIYKINIEKVN